MDPWHREDSLNEDVQSFTVDLRVFHGSILRPWRQSYMSATLSSEKVHLLKPGHLQGMPCPAALANRPTWVTLAARPHLSGALVRDQAASWCCFAGHSAVAHTTMRLRVSTTLVQLATSKYVRATFRFRGRRVEGYSCFVQRGQWLVSEVFECNTFAFDVCIQPKKGGWGCIYGLRPILTTDDGSLWPII